jgi:TonB-linked SusC/RagA family outer membrane protein
MKKNGSKAGRLIFWDPGKILLKMKLTLLFVLLGIIQAVALNGYSQSAKLTMDLRNVSVVDVLRAIEDQSDYYFVYNKDAIDLDRKVDLEAKGLDIREILDDLFANTNVRYQVSDRHIILSTIQTVQPELQISGKVTDSDGYPLPGVTVVVKNTTQGIITDADGNYSLRNVPNDAILVFSFVGMTTQEVPVSGRTVVNVIMKEESIGIEEIVAIGYGVSKVKDLTSSISTIKTEDLVKTHTGQTMQALQGKVAGLQVVNSGVPGSSPTVRVRGIGSYPGSSDTSPLYVVDGMFFSGIDFLSPTDIASISVLKDASAAAIYGVRAANGVILVETKSGRYNQKSEITYDGYYGIQVAQNVLKMANAEQFTTMAMESGSAADATNILNAMQRYGRSRINPNVPDVNTDWYKEILRTAPIQNHNFSVSGGDAKAAYSIGANYFSQDGILDMKNEYERFNLRSKIDFKATDWLTIGGNVNMSNALKYSPNDDAWSLAYWAVPILPVYDELNEDALPIKFASAQHIDYRGGQNPFPTMRFNDNQLKIREYLANFYVKVDLIPKKLSFQTTYNNASTFHSERNVELPYYVSTGLQRPNSAVTKKTETYYNQIWDNVLTYTESFGKHNLTAMAGTAYRDESWEMLTAKGIDMPSGDKKLWYIEQSDRAKIPTDDVHDDGRRQYGFSYFGRVAYNYADRYLLYGTFRADGNNKYQETWGYFPTIGAGWVISEENFMKGNHVLDFLKLRASWGELGNDKVPASDGANTVSVITTAINGQLVSGAVSTNTFSYIGWEVIEEWNVGITARLLKNRLSLDTDYFIRDNKNAVIPVYIPFAAVFVSRDNGVIRNSGFELTLDWNDNLSKDLSYNVGLNLSTLKNEVRDLYGQPYLDGGQAEFRQRSIVGEPLLAFFGYEVLGVYQNEEQIQADPVAVANNLVPGDFKYKDQNDDDIIDDNDRVVLGSFFPSFTYGVNLGLNWKNFEFSMNMMGQTGSKILNRKRGEIIWTPDLNMDADLAKNRWHGEGTSNKYPSSAGLRKGWNQKMSDYFVEDGSFFRIQNVQLAYNLKGTQLFGKKMPETRISLTADRPLTLFKYNGFNPEVADGVDRQTYPVPAVYTVGLNVKF